MKRARWFAILAIPIFLLALFQNTRDATSEWNRYSEGFIGIANFGLGDAAHTIRASGTFSYISGLQLFAGFVAGFCVTLVLASRTTKERVLYAAIAMGAIGGELASGSRSGVLIIVLQALLLATLGIYSGAVRVHRLIKICLGGMFLAPFAMILLQLQISAFEGRATGVGYDEPVERLGQVLLEWIDVGIMHPIGVGLGAGHQAFIDSLSYEQNYWEVDLSRITFEIGLIGVVGYVAFKGALCWQILYGVSRDPSAQSKMLRIFCATTCLFGILNGSLYAPVGNALFWLSAGIGLWCLQRAGVSVSPSLFVGFLGALPRKQRRSEANRVRLGS